jgi:hypothetical protein
MISPLFESISPSMSSKSIFAILFPSLARIFHELLSRDREDGRATGQPQGVGSEVYLNGTSQEPTPEDARKDGHMLGRSRQFMEYPGSIKSAGRFPIG